jgi:hypothetical protein
MMIVTTQVAIKATSHQNEEIVIRCPCQASCAKTPDSFQTKPDVLTRNA